jgi:hypothetical protein
MRPTSALDLVLALVLTGTLDLSAEAVRDMTYTFTIPE